jgi:hypothetical protein
LDRVSPRKPRSPLRPSNRESQSKAINEILSAAC